MYCRWESGLHPRESLTDLMVASKDHINSLDDHIRLLQKRIKLIEGKLATQQTVLINGNLTNKSDCLNDNRFLYNRNIYDEMNLKLQQKKNEFDPLMVTSFGSKGPDGIINLMNEENHESMADDVMIDTLSDEIESVALDWKSARGVKECPCSTPLDFATRKSHCWRCGDIFCARCLDKWASLPGHLSQKQSPVCRSCYRILIKSSSVESPE